MIQRIAKALGGALIFGSCLPMIAVLPGGLATGLGALGIRATGGPFEPVARALAPIAQPLLIIGVLLLLVAALRCSWTATAIVAIGGVLLYVSMYQLPGMTSAGDGHSGMGGMTGMETHPHPESLSDIAELRVPPMRGSFTRD